MRRVVELDLRCVDGRRVGRNGRNQLIDERVLGVELLLGGEILFGECRIARQVEFSVGEIGFVLRLLRGRLIEGSLKRTRVDPGQKVARLHHLAFVEGDLVDLAVDPRADQDGIEGLDLSKPFKDQREIRSLDRSHGDRYRRRAGLDLARRRSLTGGEAVRRPDRAMQAVSEPCKNGNPTVCRFGRIYPICGGGYHRQDRYPCHSPKPHLPSPSGCLPQGARKISSERRRALIPSIRPTVSQIKQI